MFGEKFIISPTAERTLSRRLDSRKKGGPHTSGKLFARAIYIRQSARSMRLEIGRVASDLSRDNDASIRHLLGRL